MSPCFTRMSYLSFGSELANRKRQSLQPCESVTDNNACLTIIRVDTVGCTVFAGRRHQKIIEVMMLIEITGETVKFIRNKSIQENFINMRLHEPEYTDFVTTVITNITLRLLGSFNTLNSKFRTILINRLQLTLKDLYFPATLTFLRFAAKHSSIA